MATPKKTAGFPTVLDQVKVRDVLAHFANQINAAFTNLPEVRTETADVKEVANMRFRLAVLSKDVSAMKKMFDTNTIATQAMSDDDDPIQKIETFIDRTAKRGRKAKEANPLEDF